MTHESAVPRHKPMTKAQLRGIVAEYASEFPDWTLVHGGVAFSRRSGPIRQLIWFQDMRAYYRPSLVIETTVHQVPSMLPQVLDVKHREVEHRWHERKFAATLAAMEQQFRPDVRKPLDLAEVLALCEARAAEMPDTTNNMTMLAILHAWLGHEVEALNRCERAQHCPMPTLAPVPEWEEDMRAFDRQLALAIHAGRGKAFLQEAIERQPAAECHGVGSTVHQDV